MSCHISTSSGDRTVRWHPSSVLSDSEHAAPGKSDVGADRVVAGRYRVRGLIGTGGMGSVWSAYDGVLRREVALKRVEDRQGDPTWSASGEARAAAGIAHPGVVQVHDLIFDDDGPWIVMEALPGKALSAILRDRGRLRVDEAVAIGMHLLSALQAIHEAGLVHRDVKPSNVQLCGRDRVVLTDFGLSSPRGVWGGLHAGAIAGSLPFLAPESIIDGRFGPASDLYALGVTLYKAVEGRPPFDLGESLTVGAVRARSPQRAVHAGHLSGVLEGLLENDPATRLDVVQARSALGALEDAADLASAG